MKHTGGAYLMFFIFLITASLFAAPTVFIAQGQSLQQIERELQQVRAAQAQREVQIKSLAEEVKALDSKEAETYKRIGILNANIVKLENQRGETQLLVDKTKTKVATVGQHISKLDVQIQQQGLEVQQLIRALDHDRAGRYTRLLSRAESIYDFVVKARDLNRFGQQDLGVITSLQDNVSELTLQQQELLNYTEQLNDYQRQLVERQDKLKQSRNELANDLKVLQKTKAGRQALLLQSLEAQKKGTQQLDDLISAAVTERQRIEEERQRQLVAERLRREAEQRRIQAIQDEKRRKAELAKEKILQEKAPVLPEPAKLPGAVGRLAFPLSGGTVVTEFGENEYISIRGPEAGSAVRAAADGVVLRAQLLEANVGYTIIIMHTNAYPAVVTYYENLQADVLVRAGSSVNRGQVIGYTGGGTLIDQDILHFGVRVQNSAGAPILPVNPRRYF